MQLSPEDIVKAVRWKLDIPVDQDAMRSQELWTEFTKSSEYQEQTSRICQSLAKMLEQALRCKLGLLNIKAEDKREFVDSLWESFVGWLSVNEIRRSPNVSRMIKGALTQVSLAPRTRPSPYTTQKALQMYTTPSNREEKPPTARSSTWQVRGPSDGGSMLTSQAPKQPLPAELPDRPAVAGRSPEVRPSDPVPAASVSGTPPAQETTITALTPVAAQWKYLPVPEGPDKHEEYDCRSTVSPEGLRVIGARVRGGSHKHQGTNCDDWFEFVVSGPWTIIAVSDGAGSHKFSRVGARVSCQAAVERLAADLKDHRIKQREIWSSDTFKRDETNGVFTEEDLEFVQQALHRAMQVAYDAVEAAAKERADSPEHESILGRKLVLTDLSGTFLLAVHTTVMYKGTDYSFVLTCMVGDGMLAVVGREGTLQLLGVPDKGEFAGQVDFLTSPKKLESDNLVRKTFPFFRPMQALMVMTDGVADIYFPNDPGMLRLYGDLVLNQVLDMRGPHMDEIVAALTNTRLPTLDEVAKAEFHSVMKSITADGPREVSMRSVVAYAEKLGLPLVEVVASPALLLAGAQGGKVFDEPSSESRLQSWLDAYEARGERDDRTLVILYREMVS